MNRIRSFAAMLIALMGSAWVQAHPLSPPPLPATLASLQQAAAAQSRPFAVLVYLPQVKTSRKMQQRTWKDPELSRYRDAHYLVQEINALEAEQEFLSQYQVQHFPTVIIFSPEGRMMGRTEGFVEASTLTQILRKHVLRLHQRQPLRSLPPLVIDLAPLPHPKPKPRPSLAAAAVPVAPPLAAGRSLGAHLRRSVPGWEAYALPPFSRPQLGVQVGAHPNEKALASQVRRLEKIWRGPLWVYAEETGTEAVFKVVVGQYDDPAQAARFAQGLQDLAGLPAHVMTLPEEGK